jgi:hypothetical protein
MYDDDPKVRTYNRVIRKVNKNTAPEPWVWSYTRWDSKKNLQKSTLAFNGGWWNSETPSILVVNWVSSCLSFFLSASTSPLLLRTYIFTAPNYCTTTIITLEPCALNAEFQHFILKCLHFADTTENKFLRVIYSSCVVHGLDLTFADIAKLDN